MPRTKTFSIKMADLPNMVDAIFAGDHDDPGWVEMNANDKGRACVDALFPEAHIAWRETGIGAPADWHGFVINIPDVVAEMETAPALAITRGADLDEANPDALASPIRGTDKCEGRSLNEVTALCSFDLADRHARFGLARQGINEAKVARSSSHPHCRGG